MKARKTILFYLFCCVANIALAQTNPIKGFVIDKNTKQRLTKIFIFNQQSKQGVFNDLKGEFSISVSQGDTLIANNADYFPDSVVYVGQSAIYFQLKPKAIQLKEVLISGKISPLMQLKQTQKEYKNTLEKAHPSFNFLSPITSIYNLFSREGRNARKLEKIIEQDYQESVIDSRFNATYVNRILRLSEEELKDYMLQYRPTYKLALNADEYDFIRYIKNSYQSYRYNPSAFRLQKLITTP